MTFFYDKCLIFLCCFGYFSGADGMNTAFVSDIRKDTVQMEAVEVFGESTSQKLEGTVFKPSVLNVRAKQATSTPLVELLSSLPGVRIRQSGGMGSDAHLMVGGISGKGVPVFLDGVPIHLLGSAYGINHLSSAWVDNIQVYKGAVPISLGADALGGAVNITSMSASHDYLDASYSIGSWNTHQAALSSRRFFGKSVRQFVQADLSFRHADNDYQMDDVDVVIDKLGNTVKGSTNRFHDAYTGYSGRVQYGILNAGWADEFRLSTAGARFYKQWQHGLMAALPWGEVTSDETEWNHSVLWRKESRDSRWQASVLAGYNQRQVNFVDTAASVYYWDGTHVPKSLKGESGFYTNGRTPQLHIKNGFTRATATYVWDEKHRLNYTALWTMESLRGIDEAGSATFRGDIYGTPQRLVKYFNGLSLASDLRRQRLVNVITVKHYYANSHVATLKSDNTIGEYVRNTQSLLGFGDVAKYQFLDRLAAYAGYEYTARLPDSEELFGDGISIAINGDLVAERSHNLRLGVQWENDHRIQASIGGFFRKTRDQLFLSAVSQGMAAYLNLVNTQTDGMEAAVTFRPVHHLSFHINLTYQDIVLTAPDRYGKIANRYVGSKLPNIPNLFGNASVNFVLPAPLGEGTKLLIGYDASYVRRFFLGWERDGLAATKATIPTQLLHHVTVTYTAPQNRYGISVDCRNITNAKAFDHFMVQRPGRGLFLKFRYLIQSYG